jgi:hypothetical protein
MKHSLVSLKHVCAAVLLAGLLACATKAPIAQEGTSIGAATMLRDGTIHLQLRAEYLRAASAIPSFLFGLERRTTTKSFAI